MARTMALTVFFTESEAYRQLDRRRQKRGGGGGQMDPKALAKAMAADRPSLEKNLQQDSSNVDRILQSRLGTDKMAQELLALKSFAPLKKLVSQLPKGDKVWQSFVEIAIKRGGNTGVGFVLYVLGIYDQIQQELAKGTSLANVAQTLKLGGSGGAGNDNDDDDDDDDEMQLEARKRGFRAIPLTVAWIQRYPEKWKNQTIAIVDGQEWPSSGEPYGAQILGISPPKQKKGAWILDIKVDHDSEPGQYGDDHFERFSEGEYSTQNGSGAVPGFNRGNVIVTGSGADPVYRIIRTEKYLLRHVNPKKDPDLYQEAWMRIFNRLIKMDTDRLDIGGDDSHADFAQFLFGAGTRLQDLQNAKYVSRMVKLWKRKGFPEMEDAFYAGRKVLTAARTTVKMLKSKRT